MKTPSFRDVERLSAYLDGELSRAEKTRLDSRLQSDPDLAVALDDLRNARTMLRRTPKRRAPRNFTLTPNMARIRPPVPRAVPALAWASAVAMLLFVFTFGSGLIGQLSIGSGAPMMAAAPANDARGIGGGAPEATEFPVSAAPQNTPTPETSMLLAPQATQLNVSATGETPTVPNARPGSVIPWPVVWLGLAVSLSAAAFAIRWLRDRTFRRKLKS